jgi:hypothetical protein
MSFLMADLLQLPSSPAGMHAYRLLLALRGGG